MSGYASLREVREITEATLRMEGRDPADYNVSGIMRDAFYSRGAGFGWGAFGMEQEWRDAVTRHQKRDARVRELRRAVAAGLAGIMVTADRQLCSGGREPIPVGAKAYEDADGWVFCPVHIPEPDPARNGARIEYDRAALPA